MRIWVAHPMLTQSKGDKSNNKDGKESGSAKSADTSIGSCLIDARTNEVELALRRGNSAIDVVPIPFSDSLTNGRRNTDKVILVCCTGNLEETTYLIWLHRSYLLGWKLLNTCANVTALPVIRILLSVHKRAGVAVKRKRWSRRNRWSS